MKRIEVGFLLACLAIGLGASRLQAQGSGGRVFNPTPDTVAIYEFNGFSNLPDGTAFPNGTVVPDLSGNGLDATVEGNGGGDLSINTGDPNFDNPPGSDRECRRSTFASHQARLAVNEDFDQFEMAADQSFSVELYVNRETVVGSANWGILAGTWHSRNLLDDSVGDPDNNGAWYGYGLIRNDVAGNPGAGGEWSWVLSPVVDGVPRIGFGQQPEQHTFFNIDEGRHYVVLSMDRVAQSAVIYVDAVEVGRRDFLPPEWDFTTPAGYDHARFLMFSGEDDPTVGSYRGSPAGTHLDAVRIQRVALTVEEIQEIWSNIQAGASSPPTDTAVRAVLTASKTSVIVNQCVLLSAENSTPGQGQTITKYEWKVGAGNFEQGAATREVSFDAANEAGIDVTLRVTNSAALSSVAHTLIRVKNPPVNSRIAAFLGARRMEGKNIIIPVGSVLTLDGTASATDVPPDALTCPLADNLPVPPTPIVEYRWDLDGKRLTIEDTRPSFDTAPFTSAGQFKAALQVKNASGIASTFTTLNVKIVDSGGNNQVFYNTDSTIVHFEFSDIPGIANGDPLPNDLKIADLSPNELDGVVEANDGADLTLDAGSPVFDAPSGSSPEIRRTQFTGGNPRIAINQDQNKFEMGPDDSFSVELYVHRETVVGSANWGILAGTWHSRNLLDDTMQPPEDNGAWYGYGLIRNDKDANPPFEWSWVLSPVVNGIPRIGFKEAPEQHLTPFFDISEGYHYIVLTVDRLAARAAGYVDGVEVTREAIPLDWSFTTPDGYEHARFLLFSGEDDPTVGSYRGSPAGTHIEALRVQGAALSKEQVTANWENICSGLGADHPLVPPGTVFHRGDADDNGELQLTDAIRILGFLFLGQAAPLCLDAADADDNGELQLTDAIRVLGYLFLGGAPPASPGPPPNPCGVDPVAGKHLGCASYTKC